MQAVKQRLSALHNRSQPIAVADFDLPERGLIVFGLEDGEGASLIELGEPQRDFLVPDQDTESAAHLILQDRTTKTCFTTSELPSYRLKAFKLDTLADSSMFGLPDPSNCWDGREQSLHTSLLFAVKGAVDHPVPFDTFDKRFRYEAHSRC